jgi:transcriptional regulator with XRE-family HTH domain
MSSSLPSRPRRAASPEQCRAARALLNWTQDQLAEEARVARKRIAELEVGHRLISLRTRLTITEALERRGVELVPPSESAGEGVRLKGLEDAD